jgi:hypothetical protein
MDARLWRGTKELLLFQAFPSPQLQPTQPDPKCQVSSFVMLIHLYSCACPPIRPWIYGTLPVDMGVLASSGRSEQATNKRFTQLQGA